MYLDNMRFAKLFQALPAYVLIPLSPTAFYTLILAILLWNLYRNRNAPNLPPGPYSLPMIGNLHQLEKLHHRGLHELSKKYGPVTFLKLGSVPAVVVSSSEMARVFLTTHDANFASRPAIAAGKYFGYNYKDVAFAPYGDHWREMRKLCVVELLNTKRVESFKDVRQEEVSAMIRSVWKKSKQGTIPVNLSKILWSMASGIMWRILTGSNLYSEEGPGKELLSQISSAAGAFVIGDFIPWLDWLDLQGLKRRMKKLHESYDEFIAKIVNQHVERRRRISDTAQKQNQRRSKDIIDVLLETEMVQSNGDMKITPDRIKAIVFDMFSAGMETASTTLDWAMTSLIKSPGVARKLQEEVDSAVGIRGMIQESDIASMEYVQCVVRESLRLYPPVPLLVPHESLEACTVGVGAQQYFIPKRTRIVFNAWAIGRDPIVWEDPLAFRPERFMGKNINLNVKGKESFDALPFGAGRRGCPGAPLAMATLELAIAQLVRCFDWTVEGDPSALDMSEAFGMSMPRRAELVALPRLRVPETAIFSQQDGH